MPSVLVPREQFEAGRLPMICVRTGERADRWWNVTLATIPKWTWVFLPLGFLPFVLARLVFAKRARGFVPVTGEVSRRHRRTRRWAIATGVTSVALGIAVTALPYTRLTLPLQVLLILGGVGVIIAGDGFAQWLQVAGGPVLDDRSAVLIERAHPAFVEAIREGHPPSPFPPATRSTPQAARLG